MRWKRGQRKRGCLLAGHTPKVKHAGKAHPQGLALLGGVFWDQHGLAHNQGGSGWRVSAAIERPASIAVHQQ